MIGLSPLFFERFLLQDRIGCLSDGAGLYPFFLECPFQRIFANLLEGILQTCSMADIGDMEGILWASVMAVIAFAREGFFNALIN